MNKLEKSFLFFNLIQCLLLAVFSYSYVDLNLTLSQNKISLLFIHLMQGLGYYNRYLATAIFVTFILVFFGFFIANLRFFSSSKLGKKYLAIQVLLSVFVLAFSYPFLSSDIFNYMFDAKIISVYHLSPYTHKALDFPADDWIRFMRWVHRYSPYGPLWLAISQIPFNLGLNKFILILFNFKIFISLFHLINTYLIYKFNQKTNSSKAILAAAFYGLNPLFLMEGVVNSHNDVVLATFLILSISTFVLSKKSFSFIALLLGIFIKYLPLILLPIFALAAKYPTKIDRNRLIILNILALGLFTIFFSNIPLHVPFISSGSTQVQFQPWYLFWTIPLVCLLPNFWFFTISIALEIGSLFRYLPYLYYGDWSQPGTLEFLKVSTISFPLIALLYFLVKQKSSKSS